MAKAARTELLDRVLEGKSAEVKARVLDLIVRMGIDPEDEFFLIFIALGQLQVLIEDSPQEWQALFTSFKEELRSWENSNLRTLGQITQQIQLLERLTNGINELTSTMTQLTSASPQLQGESKNWSKTLVRLETYAEDLFHFTNVNSLQVRQIDQAYTDFKIYIPQMLEHLKEISTELTIYRNSHHQMHKQMSVTGQNTFYNFLLAFGGAMAALVVFQLLVAPLLFAL